MHVFAFLTVPNTCRLYTSSTRARRTCEACASSRPEAAPEVEGAQPSLWIVAANMRRHSSSAAVGTLCGKRGGDAEASRGGAGTMLVSTRMHYPQRMSSPVWAEVACSSSASIMFEISGVSPQNHVSSAQASWANMVSSPATTMLKADQFS